jgi:hypothetical protein
MQHADEDPRRQTIVSFGHDGRPSQEGRRIRAALDMEREEELRERHHRQLERAGEPGSLFVRRRS